MQAHDHQQHADAASTARQLRRRHLLVPTSNNWMALCLQMLAGGLVGAVICKILLGHLPFTVVLPMIFYVSLASGGLLGLLGLTIMKRQAKAPLPVFPYAVSFALLTLGSIPAYIAHQPLTNGQAIMEFCLNGEPDVIDVYDMNGTRRGRNLITTAKELSTFQMACAKAVHSAKPIPDIPALGRIDVYTDDTPSSMIYGLNDSGQAVFYLSGGGGAVVPGIFESLTTWDRTVSILITNACAAAISNITIQWDGIHLELDSLNKGAYEYFGQQAWPEDFIHISYHARLPEQSFTDILNQTPDAGMLTISVNDLGPPRYTTGEIKIPEAGRWQMR